MASEKVIIGRAFNERRPVADVRAEMKGSGLYRSGNVSGIKGGINPALISAMTQLGTQAIPDIYQGIKSGVSKVGSWFKKLLGLGIIQGGMRVRPYSNPDGSYNDLDLYSGTQKPEDYSPFMAEKRFGKHHKRAMKVKGGFAESDVPRIMQMIGSNPTFAQKLNGKAKRPHKFINAIYKELQKKN